MPDTQNKTHIAENGTHVLVVSQINNPGGGIYEDASGEIRWNSRDGVTFEFRIPSKYEAKVQGTSPRQKPGAFHEVSREPCWTGVLAGGKEFKLFATCGHTHTNLALGASDRLDQTTLAGQAAYCEATLEAEGPLGFFRGVPCCTRYFIAGFSPIYWPDFYDAVYNNGMSFSSAGCLTLVKAPLVRLILASNECRVPGGAWLSFEGEVSEDIRTSPEICKEALAFVSYLVGRSTPFLWADRFREPGHVTRVYYGVPGRYSPPSGNEQPIPLCQFTAVYKHVVSVHSELPRLFERFRSIAKDYQIDFISSPIWTAFDTYTDDKLAFACISLERLATAHDEVQKRNPQKGPPQDVHLTPEQGDAIREKLSSAIRNLKEPLGLSDEVVAFLIDKKVGNIHATPNADKLKEVFTSLGLTLTKEERQALDNRNRTLHGRKTQIGNDVQAVADETRRFDVLRTLINKATLRLMRYEGPYMDYGNPGPESSFSIGILEPSSAKNSMS